MGAEIQRHRDGLQQRGFARPVLPDQESHIGVKLQQTQLFDGRDVVGIGVVIHLRIRPDADALKVGFGGKHARHATVPHGP
ncbi:hypothetical protein D3C86_1999120 [compost metagenome]